MTKTNICVCVILTQWPSLKPCLALFIHRLDHRHLCHWYMWTHTCMMLTKSASNMLNTQNLTLYSLISLEITVFTVFLFILRGKVSFLFTHTLCPSASPLSLSARPAFYMMSEMLTPLSFKVSSSIFAISLKTLVYHLRLSAGKTMTPFLF